MAHQRTHSTSEGLRGPHSVSLKVLRLSKPSLAYQHPLPHSGSGGGDDPSNEFYISPRASLSYPSADGVVDPFIISPVLELPVAFGQAYVGETFSCTLCANNELAGPEAGRTVSGVRLVAEMQTPSNPTGVALELRGVEREGLDRSHTLDPGDSIQKILRFELVEEGTHILAVTVTYTETQLASEGRAAGGRVRTFRKLYQFVALQLLAVRTKAAELPARNGLSRYALEAQLENMGEHPISMEAVNIATPPQYRSTSLNWDLHLLSGQAAPSNSPVLNPRDVHQVAFLIEERAADEAADEQQASPPVLAAAAAAADDGRKALGQLSIQWRSALGDRGSLSTGWLTSRR